MKNILLNGKYCYHKNILKPIKIVSLCNNSLISSKKLSTFYFTIQRFVYIFIHKNVKVVAGEVNCTGDQ